jgi:protein-S-isoprenylcysteine O-methyltransferase Ste14
MFPPVDGRATARAAPRRLGGGEVAGRTGGLYRHVRHPGYAGMLLYMAGHVLVFRCWLGLLPVAGGCSTR